MNKYFFKCRILFYLALNCTKPIKYQCFLYNLIYLIILFYFVTFIVLLHYSFFLFMLLEKSEITNFALFVIIVALYYL